MRLLLRDHLDAIVGILLHLAARSDHHSTSRSPTGIEGVAGGTASSRHHRDHLLAAAVEAEQLPSLVT